MSCSSATAAATWYIDNTMILQLGTLVSLGDELDAPLTDGITGTVITTAVVTGRLEDAAGNLIAGGGFPITLAHVSGGVYRGSALAAVAVELGAEYVAEIVATVSGNTATWRIPVTVEQRTG